MNRRPPVQPVAEKAVQKHDIHCGESFGPSQRGLMAASRRRGPPCCSTEHGPRTRSASSFRSASSSTLWSGPERNVSDSSLQVRAPWGSVAQVNHLYSRP
jgi:hypothetical protein